MSIIKIELDLEDMFDEDMTEDGGTSLSDIIKDNIVSGAMHEVRKMCHSKITDLVGDSVRELMKNKVDGMISEKLAAFIDDPEMKITERYGQEEHTITHLMGKYISDSLGGGDLEKIINAKLVQHVKDLKKNYDLAFAASVVNALHDQKMLNHDGLSALMNKNV